MTQVFNFRINALVERDGRKATAEFYGVSVSTIDRWKRGSEPRDSSTRSSIMNRGKRITGSAISVRDKEGKLTFEQFSKEETEEIQDIFGSKKLDKRERGLFESISKRIENQLRQALSSARTAGDKIIANQKLIDFLEIKNEKLKEIVELYQKAKSSNDGNDWNDYRNAYQSFKSSF